MKPKIALIFSSNSNATQFGHVVIIISLYLQGMVNKRTSYKYERFLIIRLGYDSTDTT